jgi:hypothetical protein
LIRDNLGIKSERISKNKKKRKGNCDPIRKDCFLSAKGFDLLNVCYFGSKYSSYLYKNWRGLLFMLVAIYVDRHQCRWTLLF